MHEIIQSHKTRVKKIIENARHSINPKFDLKTFKTTSICETPQGEKLTLENMEKIYTKHHPDWDTKFQSFPG